jgi:pimeloyl-ACP methyl ester carboxylesterase
MRARVRRRWLLAFLLLLPLSLLVDRIRTVPPIHRAEWLEAGGMRWRAVRAGRGDTTLVLLHGYGEHLLTWRWVFDALAKEHTVLAVDLPGFGGSDKPAGPYTVQAMVARLQALIDRWTTGPLILVGHSMGGALAAALALEAPERIVALVLIAPAGLDRGLSRIGDLGEGGRTAIGWWESLRAFITPLHDPTWLAEPEPMASYDPTADPAYRASATRVLEEFEFDGMDSGFARLDRPVLLIWGRNDPVIPYSTAARLAELLPCRRLETLNTLHRPQVERPDTVTRLLRAFLAAPGCAP